MHACRRHHRDRLKRARRFYWGNNRDLSQEDPRYLGMVLSTPHLCSGYCCGNPRKWFGQRTIQERRLMQQVED